jgi:hypothetical protein
MIAQPVAGANAQDAAEVARFDEPIADPTLEATVERVRAWGGDPRRYRVSLSRGLPALGSDPDLAAVRSVAAIAGWRAGVLDLRADALARVAGLPASAVASTLGLAADRLDWFLTAQRADRFAWPDQRAGAVIARVGGFRGLGGVWVVRPSGADALGDGRFRVVCGDESWIIRADIFGSAVMRADPEAPTPDAPTDAAAGGGVEAVVSPNSYLVDLVRRA